MRHILPILPVTLFILLFSPIQAETSSSKQQLKSVLDELDQATKQRHQHNEQVEKLSKQLECNWTLIRAYEACDQQHKKNAQEHLNCSKKAKQAAAQCLQRAGQKE